MKVEKEMYVFESRVRFSEADVTGNLRLEKLLDYFQDVCTFQSEDLGIGVEYLAPLGLAWVLNSWQIVVNRYPKLGEKIIVGTFPYEFKGCLGMRNFCLKTEAGEMLAMANSVWALINLETKLPGKPNEKMHRAYCLEPKLEMEYAPRKIAVTGEGVLQEEIAVHPGLLDVNDHVNNGQYVRMAMGFLQEGERVDQLRAEYRNSAKLGDVICPEVLREDQKVTVLLKDKSGAIYCVVELLLGEKEC